MSKSPIINNRVLSKIYTSIDGYIPSIIAIGLLRARGSFQIGVSSSFESSLNTEILPALLHPLTITVIYLIFGAFCFNALFDSYRKVSVVIVSVPATITYILGFFKSDSPFIVLLAVAFSNLFTVYMIRVWAEDNWSSNIRAIAWRIGLSFVVQYVAYTLAATLSLFPQILFTIILPSIIAGCLLLKPEKSGEVLEEECRSGGPTKTGLGLMAVSIGFSSLAHAAIFSLQGTISSMWVIGPLAVALIMLISANKFKGAFLFGTPVCTTILFQCMGIIPIVFSGQDVNWVSLSKSMSYSATVMLTTTVGCWSGQVLKRSRGRMVMICMAISYAAFYLAVLFFEGMEFASGIIVTTAFFLLIFTALPMIVGGWSEFESIKLHDSLGDKSELVSEQIEELTKTHGLTPRELEVLLCLVQGKQIKEIASDYTLSKNTIRSQVQSLYRKLNVHSRRELLNSSRKNNRK